MVTYVQYGLFGLWLLVNLPKSLIDWSFVNYVVSYGYTTAPPEVINLDFNFSFSGVAAQISVTYDILFFPSPDASMQGDGV